MVVLMNHELIQSQKEDALNTLKVDTFIFLPSDLQKLWKQIPPDEEDITVIVEPIINWLSSNSKQGDYILVHGDFGATCVVVSWGLNNKRIPVYSTTQRIYQKTTNESGEIVNVHTFKHVMFRKYKMM